MYEINRGEDVIFNDEYKMLNVYLLCCLFFILFL